MYKILIVITHPEGGVSSQVISFDDRDEANTAAEQANSMDIGRGDIHVTKLYSQWGY
jgi:hypothetical protein